MSPGIVINEVRCTQRGLVFRWDGYVWWLVRR